MSISEQVKELRDYANLAAISKSEENMILRAADTIESLSAKLAAAPIRKPMRNVASEQTRLRKG